MKIMITGGSGLLGQYLNIELSKNNDILSLYNFHPGNCIYFNNLKTDLLDFQRLETAFKSFMPEIVVHTASISKSDLADKLPREYVIGVNVNVCEKIAELCYKYEAKLIYTSTDLVYDGDQGSMLEETAALNPVSFYAETKLAGEEKIMAACENYIILRTALLYGFGLNHSENHFRQMYLNLKTGRPVKLFCDQFRTPLSLKNAAGIISELTRKNITKEIINFGGKERVSRLDIGMILCEEVELDKSLIVKISMDEVENIPKVADVSMSTIKLNSLGIWQASIRHSVRELLSEKGD